MAEKWDASEEVAMTIPLGGIKGGNARSNDRHLIKPRLAAARQPGNRNGHHRT
jgi:hypothetical protein